MIKSSLIITLLFITQACTFSGYKAEHDFTLHSNNEYKDNGNSIIIAGINTYFYIPGGFSESDFTEINWCKDDKKKKCKEIFYFNPYSGIKFKNNYKNKYNFYSINPGYYYLDEIKQQRNHPEYLLLFPLLAYSHTGLKPNFNTSLSGWNISLKAPNFASFQANIGEIVYIGDLNFTFEKQKYWIRGKIHLEIEDHYSDAVKYFHEEFPEYKNKPVIKRLAQPGVLLDNYDAGIFW